MTRRQKSDAFLKSIGPRKLTDEEHRTYVLLCIEEGSLDTGEGIQDAILKNLQCKQKDTTKEGLAEFNSL